MATTPNVDFVSGAILTAAQQNQFPRGLMTAPVKNTTTQGSVSTEVALTSMTLTFTAVANRIYKFTWFEPNIDAAAGVSSSLIGRVRLTNISGTVLGLGYLNTGLGANAVFLSVTGYFTPSAGTTTIICTAASSPANGSLNRASTYPAIFMVEDIGAA